MHLCYKCLWRIDTYNLYQMHSVYSKGLLFDPLCHPDKQRRSSLLLIVYWLMQIYFSCFYESIVVINLHAIRSIWCQMPLGYFVAYDVISVHYDYLFQVLYYNPTCLIWRRKLYVIVTPTAFLCKPIWPSCIYCCDAYHEAISYIFTFFR